MMTMRVILATALLALAACGVESAPVPPEDQAQPPGLSLSGTVSVGVARTGTN